MTTLQTFADYGAAPGPEIDAPEVRHHTKRAVLDWYAAVIPGSVEAPAVWTGIGAAGTAIYGMVFLDDVVSTLKLVSISLVILGVIGLQLSGSSH